MIILFGASASGKTEIAKYLAKKYGIIKAVTHTTRPIRNGEINGVDYHFVTKSQFLQMEENNELVESTFYNGNLYGCSRKEVADNKCIVVDPAGLNHFQQLGSSRIIAFYLDASESKREERMKSRGDKDEDIAKRLENDRLTFNADVKEKADIIIRVEDQTIDQLGDFIYEQYQKILAKVS